MRQVITLRQTAAAVFLVAGVQLALQLSLIARGVQYAAASLTIDDTYYYLQTAWNTKQLGFVTFDGLHPTNGVQFLWFAIILLLAFLTQTKTALLFLTLAVSFVFNALCYLVILKIASVLQRPALALLMASLWLLQCLPFRIYSMGMENSLHALVFWCVIWQSVEFLVRVRNGEKPNIWGLTGSAVGGLVCLLHDEAGVCLPAGRQIHSEATREGHRGYQPGGRPGPDRSSERVSADGRIFSPRLRPGQDERC
jgi:hypothetical protein